MKLNACRISAPWSIGAGQEPTVKHSPRLGTTIGRRVALGGGESSEARQAELALLGCTHRRERMSFVIVDVGPEPLAPVDPSFLECEPGALSQLPLAEPDRAVALDHLERDPRRGEEHGLPALSDPEWAAAAPGGEAHIALTLGD